MAFSTIRSIQADGRHLPTRDSVGGIPLLGSKSVVLASKVFFFFIISVLLISVIS